MAMGLSAAACEGLQRLGEVISYNAEVAHCRHLYLEPANLYAQLARYPDPLEFLRRESLAHELDALRQSDLRRALALPAYWNDGHASVFVLPPADWASRIASTFHTRLGELQPHRAHAVLTPSDDGCLRAMVQARTLPGSLASPKRWLIEHLPSHELDHFVSAFSATRWGPCARRCFAPGNERRAHPPRLAPTPTTTNCTMRKHLFLLLAFVTLVLSGCGYNTFQSTDEQIKASWSEVLNQYQRRADLVPNLVSTVKGEAQFEQQTLTQVIEARSRATSIQATPELVNDPEAFQKFQQAQGQLSGALSRLLVVSESYPTLKANQAFRDLQAQLEGTENRITVARNRYIQAVQTYNVAVRSFPSNLTALALGYQPKANFTVENEKDISRPPSVSFDAAAPAARSAASGNSK
jgi:LemA protein